MLIGSYQHTLDPKGRLIVPSKFRNDLGESFIVTKGMDGCLDVYPNDEWLIFVNKLKALPTSKEKNREILRFFYSGATECEIDKQGRILLPQHLREYAKIEKELMLVGQMNKVEIWEKSILDNKQKDVDDIKALAEDLDIDF